MLKRLSQDLKLQVFTKGLDHKLKELSNKLWAYNKNKIGDYTKKHVLFEYSDQNDDIVAGLYAFMYLGFFYIDILWVEEKYRSKKVGSKLLKKAENYAKTANCLYVRTNSCSFQAPEFYLKHGYEILAKLPLQIKGQKDVFDYYFIKYLKK